MPFNPLFPSPPAAAAPRLIIHGRFGKTDSLRSFCTRSICNSFSNNDVKDGKSDVINFQATNDGQPWNCRVGL